MADFEGPASLGRRSSLLVMRVSATMGLLDGPYGEGSVSGECRTSVEAEELAFCKQRRVSSGSERDHGSLP